VLFSSGASNLSVAEDTNRATDVFLRDRMLGTTRRVSIPPAGGQFGVPSHGVAVSADGRYVLFTARPAGARTRTYLRDRLLGTTTRIGREWSRFDVIGYALSGNGRTVAYVRRGEKNGFSDLLFVRDRVARTTTELNEQPGWTFDPSVWSVQLSADGRTALVSGQSTTGAGDGAVSVWRAGGSLTQITDGTYWAKGVGMSGDGTRVAFLSEDRHLVFGDTNGARDVFVRDLTTEVTTRVDLSASGAQLPHGVEFDHWPPVAAVAAMSGDGRFVAFDSIDAGVPGDTNGTVDVFLSGPLS
jgi:Tol biopolymer transport system component